MTRRWTHPNGNIAEARLVQSMGELNYNRNRMATAFTWIKTYPVRFVALTAERIVGFWYPDPSQDAHFSAYSMWCITSLSLAGLAVMASRRLSILKFMVPVFILYPLPYYLVQVSARFLYPIFWLNLLCAGYFLNALVLRFRPQDSAPPEVRYRREVSPISQIDASGPSSGEKGRR